MDAQTRKVRVATLSVISNTSLVVMKLVVGLLIGSISIISEAIHSGVDLIAAIIALFSVKTSSIPPDKQHLFGHGKIENGGYAKRGVRTISGTIRILSRDRFLAQISCRSFPAPVDYAYRSAETGAFPRSCFGLCPSPKCFCRNTAYHG
jgi:hypothetical protein